MSKGHTAVNLFMEDKTRYADFFNENFFSRKADCFRHVDGETYRAIGELLQSKQILEKSVSKEEMECEKDMCKALEDLYQHGKRDGEDKKLREQVEKKLKTGSTMEELKYGDEISQVRIDLVNFALKYVGGKYVWGGTKLGKGVDCSGFTMKIYQKYGIYLPHSSRAQPGHGTKISRDQIRPGDLIFYGNGSSINHVAIYIGNGQVVHASNARDGIKISSAFYRTPVCIVSYLP